MLEVEEYENQMEIDQPSSSSSSSTTASVPAAIASSPQHISTLSAVAVSSNIQHQNGYKTITNGSRDSDGSIANSGPVMNGNVDISNASNK